MRENPLASIEKREFSREQFLHKEQGDLDTIVPPWRGQEQERRDPIVKTKRWKKALLTAVTGMAFFASSGPAFSERNADQASAPIIMENGKLTIRQSSSDGHSVRYDAEPETDRKKIKENIEKIEKLKLLLADPETNKDVAYLQSVYGPNLDHVDVIQEFQTEKRLIDGHFQDLYHDDENAWDVVLAGEYDLFWNVQNIISRANAAGKRPAIEGFKQDGNFSDDDVARLIADVPDNLTNHIDKIRYRDISKSAAVFDIAGTAETVGMTGVLWEKGSVVDLYKNNYMDASHARGELRRLFYHEAVGHENDWRASNYLTLSERIEMFAEVTKFLDDPRRPRDTYIDDLIPKEGLREHLTPEEIKMQQVIELWAVAVENCRDVIKETPQNGNVFARASGAPTEKKKMQIHLVFDDSGRLNSEDTTSQPSGVSAEDGLLSPHNTESYIPLVRKWLNIIASRH
jgi:hypothetical protein